ADLLKVLTTGVLYGAATLTQTNAAGQPVAVWVLGTVAVAEQTFDGADPTSQHLTFAFGSITEVTHSSQASWSVITNSDDGPPAPDRSTLAPLPGIAPTLAVSAGPFTYDGTAHPADATATGVTGGPVSGNSTLTYYAGTDVSGTGSPTPPTQAGGYTVGAPFPSTRPSYASIDSTPLTFTIAPAALTVTTAPEVKVAGSVDPTLTYSVSGLQPGDTPEAVLTGNLVRDPGEAAGSYPIRQGTLVANGNYTLSFVGSVLYVTSAAASLTGAQSVGVSSSGGSVTGTAPGGPAGGPRPLATARR